MRWLILALLLLFTFTAFSQQQVIIPYEKVEPRGVVWLFGTTQAVKSATINQYTLDGETFYAAYITGADTIWSRPIVLRGGDVSVSFQLDTLSTTGGSISNTVLEVGVYRGKGLLTSTGNRDGIEWQTIRSFAVTDDQTFYKYSIGSQIYLSEHPASIIWIRYRQPAGQTVRLIVWVSTFPENR